ncbi:hypothetical protein JCM10049v2_004360 [Rhodotorula toruloides]
MDSELHNRPTAGPRTLTDQSLLTKPSPSSDSFEPAKPVPQLALDDADYAKPSREDGSGSWVGRTWTWLIRSENVEAHGVGPLKEEHRTDARFLSNFTLWLTMNATIACFSTGTLGPLYYSLSMRDSFLVIAFCNIFSCGIPAYISTFGPRLGMRTMGIARYSYGYYPAILPALLNLISFIGFCAVNSIVAGQVLAAVNPGHLSTTAGIVIVAVVSMFISFCGYRVLHAVERWAWLPVILAFILLTGFGGRHLGSATSFAKDVPATAANVLSFISIVVGFTISWGGCSADFNTYMHPTVPSYLVFVYTFLGLYLPCALIQILGAAFAAAALSGEVPTWEAAFGDGSVGGLVGVAMEPMNGFGKFLLVIFSLGMISNNAPTQYAFSLSLQIVFPFLTRLPRFLLPIAGTAIYLPIAIAAAAHFAAALSNFLGLLGYWSSIFVAILLIEHLLFRRGHFSSYDLSLWDRSSKLPPGIAALFASFCGAAFCVVGMDQVWYRGPLAVSLAGPSASAGGDIGFETGMAVAGVVFVPCRWIERRVFGR